LSIISNKASCQILCLPTYNLDEMKDYLINSAILLALLLFTTAFDKNDDNEPDQITATFNANVDDQIEITNGAFDIVAVQ